MLSAQFSLNLHADCIKGNCVNGQGTLTSPDGFKYVGEWKYGKPHGQGTMTFPDGELYVGEFKDNKKHGQGPRAALRRRRTSHRGYCCYFAISFASSMRGRGLEDAGPASQGHGSLMGRQRRSKITVVETIIVSALILN